MERINMDLLHHWWSTAQKGFGRLRELHQSILRGEVKRIIIGDSRLSLWGVISGISYHTEFPILLTRIYLSTFILFGSALALAFFGTALMFVLLLVCICVYSRYMECMPLASEVPHDYEERVRGLFIAV